MRLWALLTAMLFLVGPLLALVPVMTREAAGITVSGDIYSTDSWSLAVSPVHIVGNVTVHPGAMLNIMEGTEVRFEEGTHLNVEGGALTIAGTMSNPVRFLPNSSTPYKGFYEWIYVNSTPLYMGRVMADWAAFSFGVKGFYLDNVQGAVFNHVSFDLNAEAGIYLSYCSGTVIRNCTFRGSDGWGLWSDFSNNTTVSDCIFDGCTGASVLLSDSEYSSVGSCTLNASSSEKGIRLAGSSHILLSLLDIAGAPTGLELEASGNNTVFNCTFTNNGIGLFLNGSSENLFRGNRFDGCDLPLSLDGGPEVLRNGFDPDNLVGGFPVYFLNGGSLDGVNAGAVVLAGCRGSVVSNLTFPPKGGTVLVFLGADNTLRDFQLPNPHTGIAAVGVNGILVQNVTVTGALRTGIRLWRTEGIGINGCTLDGCASGVAFQGPMNISLSRTRFVGNQVDLQLSERSNVRCLDCVFQNATLDPTSQLNEDHTLTVIVRDNASRPLPGVEGRITHGASIKYATSHFGGTDPTSDAEGRLVPAEMTSVVYSGLARVSTSTTIEVWDGVHAFEWNPRTLVLAAPTTAVFSATDNGFLSGMVRDPAGDPVENVSLVVDAGPSASTGADGTYKFPPLAPGTYALNASLQGWQTQYRPAVDILLGQTTLVNLTLYPEPGAIGEVRGVVRNQTGDPVFAAFINIGGGKTTDTDAGGVFRILSAPAGWINITISKAGYLDARTTAFVPPNGASRWANVTLVPAGAGGTGDLSVEVRDAGRRPLPGAQVWLEYNMEVFLFTDGKGTCLFRNIPANVHRVFAVLSGYAAANTTVTVVQGSTANVTLVMAREGEPAGTLAGRVFNAAGAPLGNATVSIGRTAMTTTSDDLGYYRLELIPPGNYSVTASAPGHRNLTELDVGISAYNVTRRDFALGQYRKFINQSLGLLVQGDIADNVTLLTRATKAPGLLAGSLGVYIEITPVLVDPGGEPLPSEEVALDYTEVEWNYTVVDPDTGDGNGNDPGNYEPDEDVRMFYWNGSGWVQCNSSGWDSARGLLWAKAPHFSIFGAAHVGHGGNGGGSTILALPPWISPIAVVAAVLLVGVPIGIIVIRMRHPPSGGRKEPPPQPPAT